MSVIGIGVDVIECSRIQHSMERFGERFLHRVYTYRGQKRSYLSAACGAPPGFTVGVFPFVRVGMTFSDGRKLASTLIRTAPGRGVIARLCDVEPSGQGRLVGMASMISTPFEADRPPSRYP